ncbi:uncharacterized protein LOC113863047 [Abrus precatorius]|uniref:Uncharacterized protein LOC113863047 n=1 Tax=Abrus precatorius TaxID=3816 RepID=A0A8B8L7N5_ABRPR|nr:uncharacterized protein LOC113863047 [Abrus precatorius]
MGLLGKSFTSKFKTITTLAVSRIFILKNQHKARASYAWSDVAQLLNLGYHDRALPRVDQWIIEQNTLDVFAMIEIYCNFLRERAEVLEKNKECPIELKEATSSLIFASSRCGDFPELHQIREILTSKFGKEFADHAVELHKNNRVNSKMIQKLSKRPGMEIKMKALKQIASEIGVTLCLEQDPTLINMDRLNIGDPKHKENSQNAPINIQNENLADRNEERKRYKDTTAATKEALESESSGIEASKHSNHRVVLDKVHVHPTTSSSSNQEDVIISTSNHGIEQKEWERRELKKQFAWEESRLSQIPRDNVTTSKRELVSKEHVEEANGEGNMIVELGSIKSFQLDSNDHNTQSDASTENKHLSEQRIDPSSHAIRWNPQRSQADPALNHMVRRPVMVTTGRTNFPKGIHTHHEHVDWKMMSVRTR